MKNNNLTSPAGVTAPTGAEPNVELLKHTDPATSNCPRQSCVPDGCVPASATVLGPRPINRPGISAEFLQKFGVRDVDAATAAQLCELSEPGLWIPYHDGCGSPLMLHSRPYGRLRLARPQGDKKYHQLTGSGVHAYLPPGLNAAARGKDLVLVEGEFKAISLTEAGVTALGISGFYGAVDQDHLVTEVDAAFRILEPARIFLLGDTDTALNWQFSDAAVKLAQVSGRVVFLPRIPFDQPKGIDDCREKLGQQFPAFWQNLLESAETVSGTTNPDELAVKLAIRESNVLRALDAVGRGEVQRRAINMGAKLRDPGAKDRYKDFLCEVFEMKPRVVQQAIKMARDEQARELASVVPWNPDCPAEDGRPRVILPGPGREVGAFVATVAGILADKRHWFYRLKRVCVVAEDSVSKTAFVEALEATRAVTSLEQVIQTGVLKLVDGTKTFEPISIRTDVAELLIKSDELGRRVPRIDRILEVPVPVRAGDGIVSLPQAGYNPGLNIWLSSSAPALGEMSLETAIDCIKWHLGGFSFVGEQDRVHAIAHLLTPMVAGLLPAWNTRVPLFVYLGNRPRVGKDYLAAISGLIYEGRATEESPLTDDDAEVTKRLVSAMRAGRRRLHFANCSGALQSPAFEGFLTNVNFSGRVLGSSEDICVPNEVVVSLSGRTGLTMSPDLLLRARIIAQAWNDEDINGRRFPVPDLHAQVLKNRSAILSALYSIVSHWGRQGCPRGQTPFASFSDWGNVVGGVMGAARLGDPCLPQGDSLLPADCETADMKALFELVHTTRATAPLKSSEIMDIVKADPAREFFADLDFSTQAGRIKFGKMLRLFAGRTLGGFRMECTPDLKKTERSTFRFVAA